MALPLNVPAEGPLKAADKGPRVAFRDITNLEPGGKASKAQAVVVAAPAGGGGPAPAPPDAAIWAGPTGSVQDVEEYAEDIFALHKREEGRDVPGPGYLAALPEINPKMRAILVDWLIEVHAKFKLCADTLFLSVNLLDRYLALQTDTERSRLQLVGVTCLFIASKYEEVSPPEVRDFVYVTDQAYLRDDILDCEVTILNALGWRSTVTSPLAFLRRYKKILNLGEQQFCLAQYFAELPLPDVAFLQYAPSLLACAALLLSNKVLKHSPSWPPAVAATTTYDEARVKACAKQVVGLLVQPDLASLKAVKKKFSSNQYLGVAKLIA